MTLLDTSNESAIYDSLAAIFSTSRYVIEYAVLMHMFEILRLDSAEQVKLDGIRNTIERTSNAECHIDTFDYVTISHLTTRSESSIGNPEPLYNLHESLLRETELSMRLRESGITFRQSKNGIDTYLDGGLVDWESMIPNSDEESCIRMIMNRLQPNRYLPESDKCINGFLFGGDIWENSDVRHIVHLPEFVENILRVMDKRQAINEWRCSVKPYVITFQVPISKIIFDADGSNKQHEPQTQVRLLRHAFYYLSKIRQDDWDQWYNPIMRLDDNYSVDANQVLSITPV